MFEKRLRIVFIVLFLAMIFVPMIFTNLQEGKISEAENRRLVAFPSIRDEEGEINKNFNIDFESWINDNIGFRSDMVLQNAKVQYYVFKVLANNSNMFLGPNGEFNYANEDMLKSYLHLDLRTDEFLTDVTDGYQYINDYLKSQNKQFYYMACSDKHSVYPEYFPSSVIQHGDMSRVDQTVSWVKNKTDVDVIYPKDVLITSKDKYDTYSVYGDATHWTQRGAYIGYLELMNEINSKNGGSLKVLTEDDYNITLTDQGSTLFGGIHEEEMIEDFEIKSPKAVLTQDKLTLYSDDQRHKFYTNEEAGNNLRLVVVGDSYINSYIIDDIAESFHETVMIWGDYVSNIEGIINEYQPDILIYENAERADSTARFGYAGLKMKTLAEQ